MLVRRGVFPPSDRSVQGRLVLAAMLGGFVAGWDANPLFLIYPEIRDQLAGGDETSASWVLSITSIVYAALLLQAGRIADRFGHQRVFVAGASVYTVFAVASTLAPSLWWLVTFRGLMSSGMALMGPSAVAIILANSPANRHSAALGRWGFYTAVSGVAGPLVVATLIESMSWRPTFGLQIVMGLVVVVLARAPSGLDRPDHGAIVRPLDSAIAIVALVALVLPLVEGNDWGWTSARTLGLLAVALIAMAVLVLRSSDPATAPLALDLFRERNFVLAVLVSLLAGGMFWAQWISVLLYLTEVWNYTIVESALLLTIMPLGMTVLSIRAGQWVDAYGHRSVMVPGAILYAIGFGAFWVGAGAERNLAILIPALVGAGIGMATIWAPLMSAGTRGIDTHRLGTAAAVIHTFQRVGAALGVAVVVALVTTDADLDTTAQHLRGVAVMPIAAVAAAALSLGLRTRPDAA